MNFKIKYKQLQLKIISTLNKMVNYLFLDVDGVLNNWHVSSTKTTNRILGNSSKGALLMINDSLVDNLKLLYDKHNLNLILSSTWRKDANGLKAITDVLSNKGMTIQNCTPDRSGIFTSYTLSSSFEEIRTEEIAFFVDKHIDAKVDTWVAVDDVKLDLDAQNFVRTRLEKGLDKKRRDQVSALFDM
jgi:hypothetical protein